MPEPETAPSQSRGVGARFRWVLPTLCLIGIAVLGFSGALETATVQGPLRQIQDKAASYLDSSQTKAVEAFAAGRAINAAASILKSAEFTPFVVKIAPLELLEPVDDLAKQFSDVMAVSIVAILLQRLVMVVSQAWAFGVVLPIGCVLWLLAVWSYRWPSLGLRLSGLGRNIVILAIFARFVIPIAGWAGAGLTERFLANDLNKAVATMDTARGSLEQFTALADKSVDQAAPVSPSPAPLVPSPNETPSQSWGDWFGSKLSPDHS